MASPAIATTLQTLHQTTPLSILHLADPILSPSDLSNTPITPATLLADLEHYKELFSKLRFSYVEQVTKERFLKALVADPPEAVTAAQNAELEAKLRDDKTALKRRKIGAEESVEGLERLGRRLAQSYEIIQLQTTQLEALPTEIAGLEETIAALKAAQEPESEEPMLNLPLAATNDLLAEKEDELAALEREIAELTNALPDKKMQVGKLEGELGLLEERKREAIEEARHAQRQRGRGGLGEELEERGRWLKGVERAMTLMLEA